VKNVKPSAWLKQDIRHPEHLTVMVYDTRTYEKNGQRVTSFCMEIIHPFSALRTGPFRLTTALRMPKAGVLASPCIWAKARIKLAALIRQCGDGVVSNAARMGSFCMEIHPFCTQNRTVPTHYRTADAQNWCSRLAMDMGEGQNQTSCIDSPMRRRGGVECSERGVICLEFWTPMGHPRGDIPQFLR
jgi:hypothetical protein